MGVDRVRLELEWGKECDWTFSSPHLISSSTLDLRGSHLTPDTGCQRSKRMRTHPLTSSTTPRDVTGDEPSSTSKRLSNTLSFSFPTHSVSSRLRHQPINAKTLGGSDGIRMISCMKEGGGKRIVRNLDWWKEDSERFGHDWAFVY